MLRYLRERKFFLFTFLFRYGAQECVPIHVFAFINFWRCFIISNKELQINEEIRDKELRVIDADGSQLGILSSKDALRIAFEKNLDLVKIAPQATPPVCRIMDYGKYRFEQAKREKEAKKNQKVVEIKRNSLSMNIDTHDFRSKQDTRNCFLG